MGQTHGKEKNKKESSRRVGLNMDDIFCKGKEEKKSLHVILGCGSSRRDQAAGSVFGDATEQGFPMRYKACLDDVDFLDYLSWHRIEWGGVE